MAALGVDAAGNQVRLAASTRHRVGDMLEVEVGPEAEGEVWPDDEWLTLFREYEKFPSDLSYEEALDQALAEFTVMFRG